MRPIKQSAIQNDLRLLEMALYEQTKGQTRNTTQESIIQKVREYKGLIKRGTFSIDQLEDKTFSRYGIIDERSQFDTELLDATSGLDAFSGMFGGLFRKSQGMNSSSPSSLERNEPKIDDIFKELNGKFNEDKIQNDFPESDESSNTNEPLDLDLGFGDLPY